jgi:mannosyltransferase OCH1-like enzyme
LQHHVDSPNFSRLTESWKQQSGWEYRFYTDEDAANFLSTHFPPEVKQAYDDLIPGAFKADLFRYCILFIYGGVYADIDVMLTSKLEVAIDDEVGFMIPLDSVGKFALSNASNDMYCIVFRYLLINVSLHEIQKETWT